MPGSYESSLNNITWLLRDRGKTIIGHWSNKSLLWTAWRSNYCNSNERKALHLQRKDNFLPSMRMTVLIPWLYVLQQIFNYFLTKVISIRTFSSEKKNVNETSRLGFPLFRVAVLALAGGGTSGHSVAVEGQTDPAKSRYQNINL